MGHVGGGGPKQGTQGVQNKGISDQGQCFPKLFLGCLGCSNKWFWRILSTLSPILAFRWIKKALKWAILDPK